MRRFLSLTLLFFALAPIAHGVAADKVDLKIVMVRGESSRDSSSQKITIVLSGQKITYTKTFTGRRGGQTPIAIDLDLTVDDVKNIAEWLKSKNLLVTESIERQGAPKGTYFWFSLRIQSSVDTATGLINIRGPRSEELYIDARLYKDSIAFLKEVFGILHRLNREISFEAPI